MGQIRPRGKTAKSPDDDAREMTREEFGRGVRIPDGPGVLEAHIEALVKARAKHTPVAPGSRPTRKRGKR